MLIGFGALAMLVVGFIALAVWKVTRAPLGEGRGAYRSGDAGRDAQNTALDPSSRMDG
jgi:hypothetical protein